MADSRMPGRGAERRRKYPAEVRAAVKAGLLAGVAAAELAAAYNVPLGTVRVWKSRMVGQDAAGGELCLSEETKNRLADLLLAYLAEALGALRKQVVVLSDTEWLKKQSASEAAILHGVIADKSIRLLEALGAGEDDAPRGGKPTSGAGGVPAEPGRVSG